MTYDAMQFVFYAAFAVLGWWLASSQRPRGASAATSTPNRKLPTGGSVAGKPPIVLPAMVPSTSPPPMKDPKLGITGRVLDGGFMVPGRMEYISPNAEPPMTTKPENCTCLYPGVVLRNGCGHSTDCPAYRAANPAPVIATCDVCRANVMVQGERPLVLTCGKASCEATARKMIGEAFAGLSGGV